MVSEYTNIILVSDMMASGKMVNETAPENIFTFMGTNMMEIG